MKTLTSFFKKAILASTVFLSCNQYADAAIYTAVASGNFNNASTWAGGNIPPSILIADAINIPSGLTVTLNANQILNGSLSLLTVDGTLDASSNAALILTSGTLGGNGTILCDSLVLNAPLGLTFTGDIMTNECTSLGATLSAAADITVHNRLYLLGGILNITGSILNLDNNVTIVIDGGNASVSGGGLINIFNNYNVLYIGSSATTGWELTHTGLVNVEINVPATATITLSDDLDLNGNLKLTSGILNLNGHDLILNAGGNIASQGNSAISCMPPSSIMINTNVNVDGIRFTPGSNTVSNLTLNMGNHTCNMMSNVNINNVLNLQSGILNINNNTIHINIGGSTSGGSSSSYIVTGETGSVMQNVNAGSNSTYHIGTVTNYAPVVVTVNTGSTGGMIGAGVHTGVYVNGMNGAMLSDQPMVNATWHVTHSASSNININVQTMWSSAMEINGFNRNSAYISQSINSHWNMNTATAATTVNGLNTMTYNNLTTSPISLAVFDKNANTTNVSTVAAQAFMLYPNPANSILYIEQDNSQNSMIMIYDVSGRMMKAANITERTQGINIDELPSGNYNLIYKGKDSTRTMQFVKQ